MPAGAGAIAKGLPVPRPTVFAFASLSVAALISPSQAQTPDAPPPSVPTTSRANPITNPDGSVTMTIPPFNPQGGVIDRPRPQYDALGLRGGEFIVLPSLTAGAMYNSNVFNTQNATQSDWAFELAPALRVISDLPRHALSFLVGAHSLFYNRLTSENTTDVTTDLRGRLDIDRATNVSIDGGYQYLHEARGAPDLPGNAAEPTRYSMGTVEGTFNHAFNRLQVDAGVSYQRLDYEATKLNPPGPATLDNRDRDRDTVSVFGQAGYEFSPGYSAFLRGSYNNRTYDLTTDSAGYARDSHGMEVDGGVQFEITRLIIGQIYAGYLEQDFEDVRFNTVSGGAFGAQLEWYPTELTTLRFGVRHSVEETTIAGASSYTTSHVSLGVDHELLRNLILSLDGVFENNDYNGFPRTDKFWGFSLGAMYLVNRNLQLNLGYVFSRRDTNQTGLDYDNSTVRIGAVGKL
jgi:hypothetical protein